MIPNAIPLRMIDEASPTSGVSSSDLVLFVGRLAEEKDPLAFVEAIHRLPRTNPIRAIICGVGPLMRDVERAVLDANLESRIELAGYRDDVWKLLKTAKVFVSTSSVEGHPNAVDEAMAARCPIVLSDIPAHREVADETEALFVSASDSDEVAAAIVESVARGPRVEDRIRRARSRVEKRRPEDVVDRYDQVYRQILGQTSRARTFVKVLLGERS